MATASSLFTVEQNDRATSVSWHSKKGQVYTDKFGNREQAVALKSYIHANHEGEYSQIQVDGKRVRVFSPTETFRTAVGLDEVAQDQVAAIEGGAPDLAVSDASYDAPLASAEREIS